MTWTYTPTELATSTLMQVRLQIRDTDTNAQLLADEEIEQAIATERSMWGAAAQCCELIARDLLMKADVRIGRGGTTLTYSTAAAQYQQMSKDFRKRANSMVAPWAGGRLVSDKTDMAADDSLVQPIFTKTGGNNPYVGDEQLNPNDDGQIANR